MKLFTVFTPLQLINAINVKMTYYKSSSTCLIICQSFDGAEKLIDKLRKEKTFSKIYYFKNGKQYWFRKIFIILKLVLLKKCDEFLFSGYVRSLVILFWGMKFFNKSMLLNYIDDGMSSYVTSPNDVVFESKVEKDNIIEKFFRKIGESIQKTDISKFYVYEKDLVLYKKRDINYKSIPKIATNSKIKLYIDLLYSEYTDFSVTDLIIFFDQPFFTDTEGVIDERAVYNKIISQSSKEVYVKLHPRSGFNFSSVEKSLPNIPWEAMMRNIGAGNILVGMTTTAIFSPYIMYGREISCILLTKLILNDRKDFLTPEYTTILNNIIDLAELLNNKGQNIILPETWEEFYDVVERC